MTSKKPKSPQPKTSARPRDDVDVLDALIANRDDWDDLDALMAKLNKVRPASRPLTEAERRHRRPSPGAQVMEGVDIDENGNARLVQFVARIFDDPLLTEEQAAKMLGLSPLTLKKWRRTSRGPRYYRLGSAVRYNREDLEAYALASAENPQKLGHNEKGGR